MSEETEVLSASLGGKVDEPMNGKRDWLQWALFGAVIVCLIVLLYTLQQTEVLVEAAKHCNCPILSGLKLPGLA